jgi:hypothetical protein
LLAGPEVNSAQWAESVNAMNLASRLTNMLRLASWEPLAVLKDGNA